MTAPSLQRFSLTIDGRSCEAASGRWLESESPATGRAWAEVPRCDATDVEAAVSAAQRAFDDGPWPALTPTARGALLYRLADLIARDAPRLAELEQRDNGKLMAEVSVQVRAIADYFRYYAGLADKLQSAVIPTDKPGVFNFTRHEPKGVVAILTPFNSPLTLTSWKLAPALAVGCTAVVKPSEYTSASMLEMARLFAEAGFPPGVVNVVTGFGDEVGQHLVSHPAVAHIAFTGGEAAGIRVYEAAARGLKTVTLELGGKSPNIVFDDADLDQAVKGVVSGIFAAAGQTCLAGSRLLLHRPIHDAFVQRLIDFVRDVPMGDPTDPATRIGPIATRPQFEKILHYLDVARADGATCVLGGRARPDIGSGWYVEPTIFTGVHNRMRIAQEEVFGPVLAVIPFEDEDEAIRIGNDVVYGLAAGVWTRSLARAIKLSEKLRAGTVWVNNYRATSMTSPFGGYKRSGVGRENGVDAVREYQQVKSVWISTDLDVPNPFIRR
jgi:acyl-CoA reductase-like NAD-dependent aldehyde dehydrogenase